MRRGELTPKQQRFVEEYLVDLNATRAAIRAGYSARNAGKIGPELLGKTRIAAALGAAQHELSKRTQITQEQKAEGMIPKIIWQLPEAGSEYRKKAQPGDTYWGFKTKLSAQINTEYPASDGGPVVLLLGGGEFPVYAISTGHVEAIGEIGADGIYHGSLEGMSGQG